MAKRSIAIDWVDSGEVWISVYCPQHGKDKREFQGGAQLLIAPAEALQQAIALHKQKTTCTCNGDIERLLTSGAGM